MWGEILGELTKIRIGTEAALAGDPDRARQDALRSEFSAFCCIWSQRPSRLPYFGFRELGRVVRTIFLLRYLSDAELRRTIQAATNKSERFNQFVQWASFGGDSVIAENTRDEQRKFIKYIQPFGRESPSFPQHRHAQQSAQTVAVRRP
jgi:hypothetical protein